MATRKTPWRRWKKGDVAYARDYKEFVVIAQVTERGRAKAREATWDTLVVTRASGVSTGNYPSYLLQQVTANWKG